MKCLFVSFLFLFFSLPVFCQDQHPRPYLLDSFVDGTFFYQSAPPRTAKFNYHLVGQEIVMDFENKKVPVNNFPNLDSIHIGDRNFILVDGKAYEELIGQPTRLLVDHKYTSQIAANEGAYGTKSHAAAVVVADQRIRPNDFYALEWNEGYELVNRTEYYIVEGDNWSKFNSTNQLSQIFKDRKKEIKKYASENNVDLHNTAQVKALVQFAMGKE